MMDPRILSVDEIARFRSYFRDVDSFVNYQWGGYSAKPIQVLDALKSWEDLEGANPASPDTHERTSGMTDSLRAAVARLINALPEEIVFTSNTTEGHNIVAWGLELREGDRILTSKHEHPSNILPWYSVAQRRGLQVDFLSATTDDETLLDELAAMLGTNSYRLVTVAHVSRHTGYRLPAQKIARIAHQHGAFVLFDGAQTAGCIPVDVRDLDCDAYSFCGHKWLLGPQGTGGLYIRADRIEEVKISWVGAQSPVSYDLDGTVQWKEGASKHEFGTRNRAVLSGWLAAMQLLDSVGFDRIFATIRSNTQDFKDALGRMDPGVLETPYPFDRSSGIMSVRVRGVDAGAFCERLWREHRILCSPLEPPSRIRVCNHFTNTVDERETLLRAIGETVARSYPSE